MGRNSELAHVNGAVYLVTMAALDRGEALYSGVTYGYVMPKSRSIDVDYPDELEMARIMLEAA